MDGVRLRVDVDAAIGKGQVVNVMSKDYSTAEAHPDSVPSARSDRATVFGPGVLIDADIVSPGTVQVFGRLRGDIRAARLIIGDGAYVEGNMMAFDAIVQGNFKGTILGHNVQLQGRAHISGEIYNESLSIEPGVVFKGTSYRLDEAAEAARANAGSELGAPLAPAVETLDLAPQP